VRDRDVKEKLDSKSRVVGGCDTPISHSAGSRHRGTLPQKHRCIYPSMPIRDLTTRIAGLKYLS
jgi:hypothetical protein